VLAVNLVVTIGVVVLLPGSRLYALGYLASTAAGSALAGFLLSRRIAALDRAMYARYART
jgi:hypothetical protein